jgi:hypothetical protein
MTSKNWTLEGKNRTLGGDGGLKIVPIELDHTLNSITQVRIYEIEIQTSIVLNN